MSTARSHASQHFVERQRWRLLRQVEDWLETPMILLGFVWLALTVVELVRGISPLLEALNRWIWALFVVDFLLRFSLAPRKLSYLRRNVLTAVALLLPALRTLRVLRVFRVLRATRGVTLVRILSSTNRGMSALRQAMRRRGVGYVFSLTLLVILVGAAGMYAFERDSAGFGSYGEALWWTAMLITSLGSEAWPHTGEGRVLCFILALYGFTVFGYVTATLASFFVDRDAADKQSATAGQASIESLQEEIRRLREDIRRLNDPSG
ncbi:ion transporter [Pseudomonas indica]|uniref:ion transporter n=1 Tax=Pseudomonas indica TaxID=137658 RepID=UPI003FD2E5ED